MLIEADLLIDSDWCWLMLIDADWCWLMLIYFDWCWLMLNDADLFRLMLLDVKIRFNHVFFCRAYLLDWKLPPPEVFWKFIQIWRLKRLWCIIRFVNNFRTVSATSNARQQSRIATTPRRGFAARLCPVSQPYQMCNLDTFYNMFCRFVFQNCWWTLRRVSTCHMVRGSALPSCKFFVTLADIFFIFSCPDRVCGQLNRWHCHWLTDSLDEPHFVFWH